MPEPTGPARDPARETVPVARKVAFLRDPGAYPDHPRRIDVVETHMSWVFLTDDYAYKLKKPVTWSFLDFGTSAARRFFCEEEVRLNRRLAPDVYLGVAALTDEGPRGLALDGPGVAVDWLVRMRRLPEAGTLKSRIGAGQVRRPDIVALARLLAGFYQKAPVEPIAAEVYVGRIHDTIEENLAVLSDRRYGVSAELARPVLAAQQAFLAGAAELFRIRVAAGRIVEGHGDLRPEHVYLGRRPLVTDCLEFNRAFRIIDPADELAYLAMECAFLGAAEIGPWLFETYGAETGDRPPPALIHFHKSVRAGIRAKISVWHLDDASGPDPAKWSCLAGRYLTLAGRDMALAQGAA
ncbi:MAG: hypothetical protein RIE22_03930 [Alphaproteobacteria bacterium]